MLKIITKALLICFLPICVIQNAFSQTIKWEAGFDGIADNREYFNTLTTPQTILGSRIRANAGFNFDDIQQFRAGLNYFYEFGTIDTLMRPDVVMYYHAHKAPYDFYIGSFPRKNLLNYPLALLIDTLNYYRPNIEGLYLKKYGDWGHEKVWIDWTSRQTNVDREAFLFGFSGQLKHASFFIDHYFIMHHFAGPAIPIPNDHLRDNGGLFVNPGINLSQYFSIDSVSFSSGLLSSIDRLRGVYDWQLKYGNISEIKLFHKGYGLDLLHYFGQGLDFTYGEGFYKAYNYTRVDIFFTPIQFDKITGRFTLTFHFIQGSIDYSQSFILSADISN